MTNLGLLRWYNRINRDVYGGRLPVAYIRFGRTDKDAMEQTLVVDGRALILLDWRLREYDAICAWLICHAAVHVERWPDKTCGTDSHSDRVYVLMKSLGRRL